MSESNEDSNEDLDQTLSSYEYRGKNDINTDPQYNIEDQDREDIYHILYYIFNNGHNDSTEDEGFVENGVHDLLHVTEEESSDESVIFIEENYDRYIQLDRNNSGDPIDREDTIL